MTAIIALLLSAAAAILLLMLYLWRRRPKNPFENGSALPYLRRALMTESELDVYALLLDALPEYMVFAQVQASRVLEVPSGRETYYWLNFISRLSYDFVICRTDGTPIAAIEIDDASHSRPDRQEVDNRKNKATEAAGVAILRWSADAVPDEHEIFRTIVRIDRKAA